MSGRFEIDPHLNLPINLSGHALVAAPEWSDEFFERSVVLVVHHTPEVAVGIMLNRPTAKLSPQLSSLFTGSERPREVHLGGLHSGPVVAIHQDATKSEYSPAENVHFAAQVESIKAITRSSSKLRIIVGQTQWAPGELDAQFAAGKWLPLPLSDALVFADSQILWPLAMRQIGNQLVASMTGTSVVPSSSLVN